MEKQRQQASSTSMAAVSSTPGEHAPRGLRFVDLFAGLGGFHVGLEALGHECVFACESNQQLQDVYEKNFDIRPAGDIRQVAAVDVPGHDILCAGFPCQPFSRAGKRAGASCPESGKLIDDVLRIVGHHQPSYVLLENVPNVLTIANGSFWEHIQRSLQTLGYEVQHRIYSPLQFGLPQQRLRLFVVAAKDGLLQGFKWPDPPSTPVLPLSQFVIDAPEDVRPIEPQKRAALEHWNRLIPMLPELSYLTILAAEFGADYPVEGLPYRGWRKYRGAFGVPLAHAKSRAEAIASLPQYAASRDDGRPPSWMNLSIAYSRRMYASRRNDFDAWKTGIMGLHNSWQKLEWQGDRSVRDLWHHTLQFRASGIRVVRPELAPSLVAMSETQTPIIGFKRRYLSVREAAALQTLQHLRAFPDGTARAFKALGNAVNAKIVSAIAGSLTGTGEAKDVSSQRGTRYGYVQPVAQPRLRPSPRTS